MKLVWKWDKRTCANWFIDSFLSALQKFTVFNKVLCWQNTHYFLRTFLAKLPRDFTVLPKNIYFSALRTWALKEVLLQALPYVVVFSVQQHVSASYYYPNYNLRDNEPSFEETPRRRPLGQGGSIHTHNHSSSGTINQSINQLMNQLIN